MRQRDKLHVDIIPVHATEWFTTVLICASIELFFDIAHPQL